MDKAGKYLDKLESIMDDDNCSFKVQADIAMNLLDRSGHKAVTKQEVTGTIKGSISSALTYDLVQRTRVLMSNKAKIIDVESVVID